MTAGLEMNLERHFFLYLPSLACIGLHYLNVGMIYSYLDSHSFRMQPAPQSAVLSSHLHSAFSHVPSAFHVHLSFRFILS